MMSIRDMIGKMDLRGPDRAERVQARERKKREKEAARRREEEHNDAMRQMIANGRSGRYEGSD